LSLAFLFRQRNSRKQIFLNSRASFHACVFSLDKRVAVVRFAVLNFFRVFAEFVREFLY
jgi:hypothetical protein